MNKDILVLSSGRSDEPQWTMQALLEAGLAHRAAFVVPLAEVGDYDFEEVETIGCPVNRIGPTRQWCVENCQREWFYMLDDDMKFYKQEDCSNPDNLTLLDAEDLDACFDMMDQWHRDGLVHSSMAVRTAVRGAGNEEFRVAGRANNFHGIRPEALLRHDIRFDRLEVMEDFYVTLSLLTRGYANHVMMKWMWNQRGSGIRGGCSQYRDNEMQDRSARQLAELFPDYVRLRTKKNKTGWTGMKERTDVTIQWKKAYEDSCPF